MSGGNLARDHRRLTAGVVCGAILLAGLTAGSYWHRAAKKDVTSPLEASLASSLPAAHSSFAPAPPPPAISHLTKLTPSPEAAALALRPELARSPQKFAAGLAPALSATVGRNDPQYSVKNFQGRHSTENQANHLTASFTDEGIELRRHQAHWGMRLTGWGYDENMVAAARVAPHVIANRIEYARKGLAEWYVNGPAGLEQSSG